MKKLLQSRIVHDLFEVGIFIKGIDGFLEVMGGFLLLVISKAALNSVVVFLTAHELSQDPNDQFANDFLLFAQNLPLTTKNFGALYLLLHGILKIFIFVQLLREKRWAFPFSIAVLTAFVLYQAYRYSHTHSVPLLVFTIIDVFIIFSIWNEYRYQSGRGGLIT